MAVKIRLKRLGKIRVPQYRIVVVDSRKKRDGRVIEEIGKYHPKEDPSYIDVVSERAQYWLGVGAQPTEAVETILKITGDWQKHKGLPGTEGRLKVAEPKRDKIEIFNEALKDAAKQPKGAAVTKKASKKAAAAEDKTEDKAEDKAEKKAEEPKADPVEEPKVEEPKVEEPKVEEPKVEETTAEVPASETPEGAAEQAEAAEELTAEDAGKSEA